MPEPLTTAGKTKIVRCVDCRGMMRVPARALSVFCPHCQKRVELESLRITGSHPGKRLATCGDIVVEATGWLNAEVVADNVVILGRVRGPVFASNTVEVGPKGHVIGDILAPKIVVREGAVIQGRCQMTRAPDVEEAPLSTPAEKSDDEADAAPTTGDVSAPTPARVRPLPLRPPPEPR